MASRSWLRAGILCSAYILSLPRLKNSFVFDAADARYCSAFNTCVTVLRADETCSLTGSDALCSKYRRFLSSLVEQLGHFACSSRFLSHCFLKPCKLPKLARGSVLLFSSPVNAVLNAALRDTIVLCRRTTVVQPLKVHVRQDT